MRLLIVRHGDPDYENDTLTRKGRREADLLRDRLIKQPVTAFYCSPLGRARDTAAPTLKAFGMEATVCEWLREFEGYVRFTPFGEKRIPWDLMPASLAQEPLYFDRKAWLQAPLMQTGDVKEKYAAACAGLDALLARHGYVHEGSFFRAENPNHDTVVLFCHFGIECVLLSHLLNISPVMLWQGFVALTTSVTTLVTEEREEGIASFRCNGFGDLSHLYASDEPPSFAARFCETFADADQRH